MVELAWLWQRYQPDSANVRWYRNAPAQRAPACGRLWWALARKLLVSLWRFVTQGLVPDGAVMKPAS